MEKLHLIELLSITKSMTNLKVMQLKQLKQPVKTTVKMTVKTTVFLQLLR